MNNALINLSADPPTNGHLWLIAEAASIYDHVVVMVTDNTNKHHLFSLKERMEMISLTLPITLKNVEVIGSTSLVPDVAMRMQIDTLVRGARTQKDIDEDEDVHPIHRMIYPNLLLHHLRPPDNLIQVSSTLVKALVSMDVDVSKLVPLYVKRRLEQKIRGITKIGLSPGVNVDAVVATLNCPVQIVDVRTCLDALEPFVKSLSEAERIPHIARKVREQLRGFSGVVLYTNADPNHTEYVNHTLIVTPDTDTTRLQYLIGIHRIGQAILETDVNRIKALTCK